MVYIYYLPVNCIRLTVSVHPMVYIYYLPVNCIRLTVSVHPMVYIYYLPVNCIRLTVSVHPMVYIYYLPVNCIRLTVSGSTHFPVTSLFRMTPQAFRNFLNLIGYFIFISPNPQNLLKRIRLISQNIANIPNDISL